MDEKVREIEKKYPEHKTFLNIEISDDDAKIVDPIIEDMFKSIRILLSLFSVQEESILTLKRQISLELAHSKQAEKRIDELGDGIEKHKQEFEDLQLDSWDEVPIEEINNKLYKLIGHGNE